jgi:hypothetical protein
MVSIDAEPATGDTQKTKETGRLCANSYSVILHVSISEQIGM